MIGWYWFAVAATVCYGILGFLLKVAGRSGCGTLGIMKYYMLCAAVLGAAAFMITGERPDNIFLLVLLSVLNAVLFLVVTAINIETLRVVLTNVYFPVVRSNVALVVVFSLVYFGDRLTPLQVLGIILSLAALPVLAGKGERKLFPGKGLGRNAALMGICIVAMAVLTIVVKFGAELRSPFAFITISYGLNAIITFALDGRTGRSSVFGRDGKNGRKSVFERDGKNGRKSVFERDGKNGRRSVFGRSDGPSGCDRPGEQRADRDDRSSIKSGKVVPQGTNILLGTVIGIINFVGFLALLYAFDRGPLSLAATFVGLAFVITMGLSLIVYREKFTVARIVAAVLAVSAALLLRS